MKKKYLYYILAAICLLITVGCATYPFLSNYLAERQHQDRIISYHEYVAELKENHQEIWNAVDEYNRELRQYHLKFVEGDVEDENYKNLLNIDGFGMMGYLEIPEINVWLPIYHGTGASELAAGVGHLEGSSLPAGGEGNHTILTSHSGYPSAKLFTDIKKLKEGDTFTIYVLDRKLTYQIDQILTVIPSDTSALDFVDGKDYVTLITCTPYGVNSHRLLVRGVRVTASSTEDK